MGYDLFRIGINDGPDRLPACLRAHPGGRLASRLRPRNSASASRPSASASRCWKTNSARSFSCARPASSSRRPRRTASTISRGRSSAGSTWRGRASNRRRPATGTLRIGVPSSFGRRYMIPVVAEYVSELSGGPGRHPVQRTVCQSGGRRHRTGVENRKPRGLHAGRPRLGTVRRYLVATPTYLHGRPTPRTPEDLNAHQCIVYSRGSRAHQWTFESNMAATSPRSGAHPGGRRRRHAGSDHAASGYRGPAGLECGGGTAQRRARDRPSGIFDRRLAASCGLSGDALDVAAGTKLSGFAGGRADRFAPEAGG